MEVEEVVEEVEGDEDKATPYIMSGFIFIDTFTIIVVVLKQLHVNDGELLSSVLSVEFRPALFYIFKNIRFLRCPPSLT